MTLGSGVALIRDDKVAGGRVLGSYIGREACAGCRREPVTPD